MDTDRTSVLRTWSVVAASAAGTSHTAAGRGSDDAYSFALVDGGTGIVAAVADGAGSRTGTSAWGAYTACQVVMQSAARLVDCVDAEIAAETALRELFRTVLIAIEEQADHMGLTSADLSTTLAVAILAPTAGAFAQVGDGIVVCDTAGAPSARIPEDKGEYANETVFVTSAGAVEHHLRFEYWDDGTESFALSTDGLRYKLLNIHDGGTAYEPFFTSLWTKLREADVSEAALTKFLAQLDDQTGDDKTLIAAARTMSDDRATRASPAARSSPPPIVTADEAHAPDETADHSTDAPSEVNGDPNGESSLRRQLALLGLLRRLRFFR